MRVRAAARTVARILALPPLLLIRVYQGAISPLLPAACRYTPSCSQYCATALMRFGLFKGAWLGARRILRCHPFHPGGYDPVPDPPEDERPIQRDAT